MAEKLELALIFLIEYSQEQIREHLQDRFSMYKEYVLNSHERCGYSVILGQIDPK